MTVRLFADAAAASTSPGTITNSQTTVTLASTANFPAPAVGEQFSVVILDAGSGSWNEQFPLATNYEYQPVTNNNVGTNTLTFGGGVRAAYAGTTPKAYSAQARVALVLLAEDLAAGFARIDKANTAAFTAAGIISSGRYSSSGATPALGSLQSGISTQAITGNDSCGRITLVTTGSPPGLGAVIAVVTFASAYPATPVVMLTLNNTANVATFAANPSTTAFNLQTNAALAASTTYIIGYKVECPV